MDLGAGVAVSGQIEVNAVKLENEKMSGVSVRDLTIDNILYPHSM